MANPRQRRKLRSGSHKPVHQSRRAKKNLKKQLPIRGPKVLQDAWDKHRTVRQNYEALGLVASLNPTASGGVERPLVPAVANEHPMEVDSTPEASALNAASSSSLRKGFGRIIRDENGNVLHVELAEEDPEENADVTDRLIEDIPDPSGQEGLAGWIKLGSSTAPSVPASNTSGTHVVKSLEEFARTKSGQAPRFSSAGERAELRCLVAKYGRDTEAMARDRKLNPHQRTAGQLSRAITKAGGFAEMLDGR